MPVDADPSLQRALSLSAQMIDAAHAGDWSQVSSLHAQCDQLLHGANQAVDGSEQALRELQQHHTLLMQLAGHARDAVAEQIHRHVQAHHALQAYVVTAQVG